MTKVVYSSFYQLLVVSFSNLALFIGWVAFSFGLFSTALLSVFVLILNAFSPLAFMTIFYMVFFMFGPVFLLPGGALVLLGKRAEKYFQVYPFEHSLSYQRFSKFAYELSEKRFFLISVAMIGLSLGMLLGLQT